MVRARRVAWKSKGGDGTHITMGMLAGVTITCAAFMLYMYHYHFKNGSMVHAIAPNSDQVMMVQTSSRVEPNQLPRDVSTLMIPSTPVSAVPVNQPTRGEVTDYQQVGILTSDRRDGQDEPIISPLYGRPLYRGSQKFQYYAAGDKQHLWRIPVKVKGRDCTDEHGCEEIYDGDRVEVPTYQREFSATVYKRDNLRYIPY